MREFKTKSSQQLWGEGGGVAHNSVVNELLLLYVLENYTDLKYINILDYNIKIIIKGQLGKLLEWMKRWSKWEFKSLVTQKISCMWTFRKRQSLFKIIEAAT